MAEDNNYKTKIVDFFVHYSDGQLVLWLAGLSLVGSLGYASYRAVDHYFPEKAALVQKNVIGGPQPDLCIQRDNVWYCSTVDGKSLDQLIQGSKQR